MAAAAQRRAVGGYMRAMARGCAGGWALAVALAALAGCQGSSIDSGSLALAPSGASHAPPGLKPPAVTPICLVDSDCAPLATSPCTVAVCESASHRCALAARADFSVCDSGDACVAEALCQAGACVGQKKRACDDGNPCTLDGCAAATGCSHTAQDGACSDANPCTIGDFCGDGVCKTSQNVCGCGQDSDCAAFSAADKCLGAMQCSQGACVLEPASAVVCQDGNPCTVDACNPQTGKCEFTATPDGSACDDGDVCTAGETCKAGKCDHAATLPCSVATGACSATCDAKLGCIGDAKPGSACDDGIACTSGDHCQGSSCVGASTCECQSDADCDPKGEVAACKGKVVCAAGHCVLDANQAKPCAQQGSGCLLNTCTAAGCAVVQAPAGAPCSGQSPCVIAQTCDSSGKCAGGQALSCDDGNACTKDSCDTATGCQHATGLDGTPCQDANPCTEKESCTGAVCAGAPACDDGDPCTLDLCDAGAKGVCLHQPLPDGSACQDGNPCTVGGACLGGACAPALVVDCNDGNPCTDDSCLGKGKCSHVAAKQSEPIPCDDGDACSGDDVCAGSSCKGSKSLCQCQTTSDCQQFEDGNLCNGTLLCADHACAVDLGTVVSCTASDSPCLTTQCQPATGVCVIEVTGDGGAGVPCSDGNACTLADTCGTGGVCLPGMVTGCDDGQVCTIDVCDPSLGCTFLPAGVAAAVACDDGNACTFGDVCDGGACQPGVNACQCQIDADCAAYDDGNLCNGGLICSKGSCVGDGKVVTCSGVNGACTHTTCQALTGQCGTVALPDGASCDIAASCASGGLCQAGVCVGATVAGCDDGNPCTVDSCSAQGCVHLPTAGTPCDDGNACSEGEVCGTGGTCGGGTNICACNLDSDCPDDGDKCNGVFFCGGGTCQPKVGSVIVCNPSQDNACQTNTCDPKAGVCSYVLVPAGTACTDGDACTNGDTCQVGTCKAGTTLNCADSSVCTDDGCNPVSGCYHLNNSKVCDDGNVCTVGDKCLNGQCTSGTGNCECTVTADCAAKQGNLCNGLLICKTGQCVLDPATIVTCNSSGDGPCSANLCEPKSGKCAMTPFPDGTACSDGSVCTSKDQCVGGACTGTLVSCDDKNPCTDDACDAKKGCAITPNFKACDDGNACTQGDVCTAAGTCLPGTNVCGVCKVNGDCPDDGNKCNGVPTCTGGQCVPGSVVACASTDPCKTAACVPATGACQLTPKADGTPCDDGSVCSATSACFGATCVGAALLNCDDKNACTTDSCDAKAGCQHKGVAGPCDDGNPCTIGELCSAAGTCSGGINQCACIADADCVAEDDGNLCNGVLVCSGNQCVTKPGSVVTCDTAKDNACSKNTCAPKTGVCAAVSSPNGTSCDDKSSCTIGDACNGGVCAGKALGCDDSNVCTLDSCSPSAGCVHSAADGTACSDGNACTASDLCKGGTCQPGANKCPCQVTADCAGLEDGDACNGTLICQGNQCVVDAKTVVTCGATGLGCVTAACDAKTGKCLQKPNPDGQPCGGAELCGGSGQCASGICVGANGCADDGNVCTAASCDGKGTCSQQPAPGSCNDGNACTSGDACQAGACQGGKNLCVCKIDKDCIPFDDGNLCNGVLQCQGGGCVAKPNSAVTCPAVGDACQTSACNPALGQCIIDSAPNGTACDDANACTTAGQCFGGACLVGPVNCDDKNPCTTDSCSATKGCTHAAIGGFPPTTCDDLDPCTPISICQAGKCQGILNTCGCQNDAGCKDDGNLCNGYPTCQGGTCKLKAGSPITCDASKDTTCSKATCLAATGSCVQQPVAAGAVCSDNSACTVGDVCSLGKCIGVPLDCDDAVACTLDQCTPVSGCASVPNGADCDDKNACTTDTCDAIGGCLHQSLVSGVCDDGDGCTSADGCVGGVCKGVAITCQDNNPCTSDSCAGGSCVHTPTSEGAPCGIAKSCSQGQCVANGGGGCATASDCPLPAVVLTPQASPQCWDMKCEAGMCSFYNFNAGQPCNDGQACTTSDKCQADYACTGTNTNCDDANSCTADSCDVTGSCVHAVSSGAACSDGDACTLGDVCAAGKCIAGAKVNCSDGLSCNTDSCDAVSGLCVHKVAPGFKAAFDDGSFGGLTFQSVNPQISWQLDKSKSSSAPVSLYVGYMTAIGTHTYNVGPGAATATLPSVTIPTGVSAAKLSFDLFYDRDPSESPLCTGFVDMVSVLSGSQQLLAICKPTGGFTTISVDLTAQAGKTLALVLSFIENTTNNAGQGAWFDNVAVSWSCP